MSSSRDDVGVASQSLPLVAIGHLMYTNMTFKNFLIEFHQLHYSFHCT